MSEVCLALSKCGCHHPFCSRPPRGIKLPWTLEQEAIRLEGGLLASESNPRGKVSNIVSCCGLSNQGAKDERGLEHCGSPGRYKDGIPVSALSKVAPS